MVVHDVTNYQLKYFENVKNVFNTLQNMVTVFKSATFINLISWFIIWKRIYG